MSRLPLRLPMSGMLAAPRTWGSWVGSVALFVFVALADSLVPQEKVSVPSIAYLTLGLLSPTVWMDNLEARTMPRRVESMRRTGVGVGFLALAFPFWVIASPDATRWDALWLFGSGVVGVWSWGGLAAIRSVSPVAGFLVLITTVMPLLVPSFRHVSTAWILAEELSIRWIHVGCLCVVGLLARWAGKIRKGRPCLERR